MQETYSIGLILSGGGARGMAHLGVLKALQEIGIKVDILSGTSAGAIAGAFFAAGYPIEEIASIIKTSNIFNFSNFLVRKQGLFSMKGFATLYQTYFPENSFEQLKIPLHVAATDILQGEIRYFSNGPLAEALMASSCIPLVFQPVAYQDTLFIDGGVMDNFPVEPILHQCQMRIGVDVNAIQKDISEIHMNDIIDRSFHLALNAALRHKQHQCDVFIQPPGMSRFSLFDVGKSDEIFEAGYRYALSMKPSLMRMLEKM
jgi:NTE family protein